jgi:predicted Zn-dependent protease
MRDNRLVFFSRTQALQRLSLSNPRYERLYFESLQNPPAMPDTPQVLELLLVPKLLAASDYPAADAAMEKVMAVIGDDAQLLCMRAEIKFQRKEMVAAKALLQKAAELEPDLPLLEELKRELKFPQ